MDSTIVAAVIGAFATLLGVVLSHVLTSKNNRPVAPAQSNNFAAPDSQNRGCSRILSIVSILVLIVIALWALGYIHL